VKQFLLQKKSGFITIISITKAVEPQPVRGGLLNTGVYMNCASPFQRANLLSVCVLTLVMLFSYEHLAPAAAINQQPHSTNVLAGSNATFTVVAGGQNPISYRWSFNGTNLTNSAHISGATNTTLTISNVVAGDAGNYRVVVSNSHGSATSSNATLNVLFPPSITAQPTNQTVYVGDPVAFNVTTGGTAPLSYQWKFNGTNLTGQTNAILSIAATTNQAGNYSVIVTNSYGSIQSSNATLTVLDSAPAIISQSTSQTVYAGNDITLQVVATGSKPLSYQWHFRGADIPGATGPSLTLSELLPDQAGNYQVTVSNALGGAASAYTVLTVETLYAWGRGDLGATNVPAGLTNTVQVTATDYGGYALQPDGTAANWGMGFTFPAGLSNVVELDGGGNFAVALEGKGPVRVWGSGGYGETDLPAGLTNCVSVSANTFNGLAAGADGMVAAWGYNGYGQTNVPAGLSNVVIVSAGEYHSLALKKDGTVTAWGWNAYGQTNVPAALSNVIAVAGGYGFSIALKADGTVVAWGGGGNGETNVPNGLSNVVAIAGGYEHILALKRDGTLVAWGWNAYGQTNIPPGFSNVVGIAAGGGHNILLMGCRAPQLLRQPANTTAVAGNTAVLYAAAKGRDLHYQWQFNGVDLPGAKSGYLRFISVQPTNAGNYVLIITNSFGSVTSAVATLTVNLPPIITGQPQNQTVIVSNTVSFVVSVDGTPPLNCRWYRNGFVLADGGRISGSGTTNLVISNVQSSDALNYTVVITNSFGTVTSAVATLTVLVPPQIYSQPQSQYVAVGATTALWATISVGTPPFSYQWYFNGTPLMDGGRLGGSTSYVLSITNSQPGDSGNYWVVITNIAGATTSSVAAVAVLVPPAITLQPAGQTLMQGSNVTFAAAASGDAPLSYQWYFNGSALVDNGQVSGSTTTNLTIINLQFTNGGNYVLVATNLVGSAASTPAMLAVISPPAITQPPADQNVLLGSNVVFSATVLGTQPIGCQWFFNNAPLTDDTRISGSTTTSLTVGNSQTNDIGGYFIVATNAYGAATSAVANLTVWLPVSITQQPSNQTVAVAAMPMLTVTAGGSGPLGYQWFFNNSPLTDNGRIIGSATGSLSISNVQTSDTGNYTVVVTNLLSSATSAVVTVTVVVPPSITTQPKGRSVPVGLPTMFNAAASGEAPLSYQWQLNGTNLPGATSNNYTNLAVTTNDVGAYQLVVTNGIGAVTSSVAMLTIGPVAAWGNNTSGQALPPPGLTNVVAIAAGSQFSLALKGDGTVVAWGIGPGTNVPAGLINAVAIAAGTTFGLAVRSDGSVQAWGYGTGTNVSAAASNVVAVAAGSYHGLALRSEGMVIDWGTDHKNPPPAGLSKIAAIADGLGFSLAARSDGTVAAWGSLPNLPAYFPFNVPSGLSNVVSVAAGSTWALALKSDGRVAAWGGGAATNVPASLTNATAIAASISDQGVGHNLALRSNGLVVAWGTGSSGQTNVPAALSNVVAIAAGASHSLALVSGGSPVILRPPVGGTAFSGSRFALNSVVGGQSPLSLAWMLNGANNGATNTSFIISNAQPADAGIYQITASNALGVATSVPAPVTVMDSAPFVLTQVTNAAVYFGAKLSLEPLIAGSGPMQFQWYFNGTNLPGATNNDLFIAGGNVSPGTYTLLASNAFGSTISSNVIVKVLGPVVAWGSITSPTNVPASASNAIAIAAGYYASGSDIALKADGTVISWSYNGSVTVPAGLSNVVEIAAGYYSGKGLALRTDGTVSGWGIDVSSNILATVSNIVSIEMDDAGSTFLRGDGSLARLSYTTLSYPAGLSNIVSLAPFNYGYIALRADGTLYVNPQGGFGMPPSNNVMAVAAGGYRAAQGLLLRRDGSLVGWGPTNLPPVGSNCIGVAASYYGKLAIRSDGTVAAWSSSSSDASTNVPSGLANVSVIDAGEQHVLALLTTRNFPPVYLSGALNTSALVVSSKGSSQWFGQTNVMHDGLHAAQSGFIGDNTASSMRLWVAGPINISFWWKVSSETNHDFLSFLAGGVLMTNISGETGWQPCTVSVPPGNQMLVWTYSKDGSGSAGQDAGWVDQLQLIPQPPVILTQPAAQQVVGGTNVTFAVSATGTPALSYRWRKDGSTILVTGSASYTLSNVTRTNSGTYSVVVTNIAGNVTSSNAVLAVHVPQHLGAPVLQPDGSMLLTSGDADGGTLAAADLANLQAQVSTNLVDWIPLPGALTLTNGLLQLQDPGSASYHTRFYRVLENW
jgi:alpha-tubulin suppressor-like RCC1 family protein